MNSIVSSKALAVSCPPDSGILVEINPSPSVVESADTKYSV